MMSDEHIHQSNIQVISQSNSDTDSPAVTSPKVMAINAPHGYGELSMKPDSSSSAEENEVKISKNIPQSETLQLEITTPASSIQSRPTMDIFSVDPKEDEQFIALAKKDEEEDLLLQEFVEKVDELDEQPKEPKHKKTIPKKLGRTDSVVTVELSREASPSLDFVSSTGKGSELITPKQSQAQLDPSSLLSVASSSSISTQLQDISSLIVEPSTTDPSVNSTPSELTEPADQPNYTTLDDINLDDADFVVVSLDQSPSFSSPKPSTILPPPPPVLSKPQSPEQQQQQHKILPEVPMPGARKIPPPPLKSVDLEKHNLPISIEDEDTSTPPPFGFLKEPTIGHHIDAAPILAHVHENHESDAEYKAIVVKLEPNIHYKFSVPGVHVDTSTIPSALPSKHPLPPPPAAKLPLQHPLPPIPSKSPTVAPPAITAPVTTPIFSDHFQFELISKSGNSPTVIVHLAPQQSIIAPSSTAILYYDPHIQISYASSEKSSVARAFESLFSPSKKTTQQNTNEPNISNSIRFYQNTHSSKVRAIAFYTSQAFSKGDIIPVDMDKLFANGLFIKQDSFLLGSASTFFHHDKESVKYFGSQLKGISIPFQRIRSKGLVFLQSNSGSIFAKELLQGDELLLESASINCVIAFSPTITYTFDIDLPSLSHIGNVSMSKLKISGPGVVYFQSRPLLV